uniref:Uncharacterized protein n=1 Tax=Vibrio cyclitrophicus TaxID=47951 RepID=A0A7Z1ME65_9VIBR|nr:hypothetical protein BCS91_26080 [Vibrio cyclitrophicus]PMP22873.1 hypothetical protein BCS90_25640 [Vibrio cyclitrophicus]
MDRSRFDLLIAQLDLLIAQFPALDRSITSFDRSIALYSLYRVTHTLPTGNTRQVDALITGKML